MNADICQPDAKLSVFQKRFAFGAGIVRRQSGRTVREHCSFAAGWNYCICLSTALSHNCLTLTFRPFVKPSARIPGNVANSRWNVEA